MRFLWTKIDFFFKKIGYIFVSFLNEWETDETNNASQLARSQAAVP